MYICRALLIKIRKLKRINHLLTQKLKRSYRQLAIRSFKNAYMNGYISPSVVVRQNANTGLLSTINHTDLYKVSIPQKEDDKKNYLMFFYF